MMTKEKRFSIANLLVALGLLLMLAMIVVPLFNHLDDKEWMRWTYTAGAFVVLVARFIGHDNSGSLRVKRLHGILILSGLLFCASAAMMFIPDDYVHNSWLALLLAGLIVQLYASWMIDRENKKKEN